MIFTWAKGYDYPECLAASEYSLMTVSPSKLPLPVNSHQHTYIDINTHQGHRTWGGKMEFGHFLWQGKLIRNIYEIGSQVIKSSCHNKRGTKFWAPGLPKEPRFASNLPPLVQQSHGCQSRSTSSQNINKTLKYHPRTAHTWAKTASSGHKLTKTFPFSTKV